MTTTIDPDRTIAGTGAMLATAGAVGWFALGGDSLARPGVQEYRDALFVLPFLLLAGTLACIHHLQRAEADNLERWAFRVVMVTVVVLAAANVTLVLGSEALQVLSFPLGALAWMLAMAALGAGTIRAGVFPRHVGWAIALTQPLTITLAIPLALLGWELEDRGSYTGVLVHGLVMLILAAALRDASNRRQPDKAESARDRTPRQATASIPAGGLTDNHSEGLVPSPSVAAMMVSQRINRTHRVRELRSPHGQRLRRRAGKRRDATRRRR